ncbi:MAG: hypothetical protein UT48_C0025G0005 [Parcubacteria group bacterium GW2011_GWE2_39_37]|uniref:Multidrug resistance protein MdtA-like barrel-sandwich hybrid domain-containing protein n=1 Tax=Candidatus Falkowbacteria bacterium GW2011_GWF2_39_8 TaxID=1618642 RepID=A0A0G0Q028_9BACT|nr:MAG: hypothetical protein UT48_C0025G0005 [Parcubacteria group bacterium GW2011_GWE2_39_37]KKR33518.1 MAG: hypothetical protein UT64_C0007G0020 [Candidatus Falkowbacteria bacterium GW2011_GWF2_39_8]
MLKSKKLYIIAGIIVLVIIGGTYFFTRKPKVEYTTAKAEIGNLVQTVSETGSVKTAKEIDLNFLANGKISKLLVEIGDKVTKDQILAELDYSNLLIQQKQSQANLDSSKANLAKVTNGATVQDIAINQATANQAHSAYLNSLVDQENTRKSTQESIAQAERNLSDLENGVGDTITTQKQAIAIAQTNYNNSKNTFEQSVNNKRDILLTQIEDKMSIARTALDAVNRLLTDQNLDDTFSVQDTIQGTLAKSNYDQAISLLSQANSSLAAAKNSKTDSNIALAVSDELSLLGKTLATLNYTFGGLEKTINSSVYTQSQLDSAKATISAQLTLINAAITTIQTGQQSYNDSILSLNTNLDSSRRSIEQAQAAYNASILSARNALTNARLSADQQMTSAKSRVDTNFNNWQVAKAQYEKIVASPRNEDIRLAQAQVMSSQAALESIKNQITNSVIKAPIDGQITKSNYEIGEEPNASKPVISLLTEDQYQIDVDISEADIIKVSLINPVSITFDAFGEEMKFIGDVIFIEPAQTVIQDVVYYKTTIGNIRTFASDVQLVLNSTSTESTAAATTTASSTASHNNLIKPGMTANTIITTASKENVLIVPNRSIIEKADKTKVVRVLQNQEPVEMPVIIGLKGDDGLTEIISGIKAGDEVVVSSKTSGK